jgi:fructose-1,6-bisphosphatase/inositol monophosphatase family enzyme
MTIDSGIELGAEDWDACEGAVRAAAIAGGMAAMTFFGGALAEAEVVDHVPNAATAADISATNAVLQSLAETMPSIAGKLNVGYSIFAEELAAASGSDRQTERERRIRKIIDRFGYTAPYIKRTTKEFEASFPRCLSILFDALDGTTNFRAGLPLFCSAVALFIAGVPRVGAVYDPSRSVAYYAALRTNRGREQAPNVATAWVWPVNAGKRMRLTADRTASCPRPMIATHLTRSSAVKRAEMLALLDDLTNQADATFMINSGQLALALVASGQLSAYVNNFTNTWDTAAGEVLIRAVGGQVTDFQGRDIQYGTDTKVAVVASSDEDLHGELLARIAMSTDAAMVKA